jgi:hypothetical protein
MLVLVKNNLMLINDLVRKRQRPNWCLATPKKTDSTETNVPFGSWLSAYQGCDSRGCGYIYIMVYGGLFNFECDFPIMVGT